MERYHILLVLSIGFSYCLSQCPDNWVIFQGQCYLFAHDPKTFTDAENFCLQREAHLVHIHSKLENFFVENMCQDLVSSAHWIGLTDVDIRGIWRWKHNGSITAFTDWYPGQPDNGPADNCVVIWPGHAFHWGDIACNYAAARPICQKPVSCNCDAEVGIVG